MKEPLVILAAVLIAALLGYATGDKTGYSAGYAKALARETLDNPRVTVQAIFERAVCEEKLRNCTCP